MAEHGRVIVITDKDNNKEVWGSITELSNKHGLAYGYIKSLKYPFFYRGVQFERLDFRSKPTENGVVFGKARGEK